MLEDLDMGNKNVKDFLVARIKRFLEHGTDEQAKITCVYNHTLDRSCNFCSHRYFQNVLNDVKDFELKEKQRK